MDAKNKPNEIYLTRIYDAPVKMVWEAWTDPKQAAQWWGPRGFSITTHSSDVRTGGAWDYTMHGPDGRDYPNYTQYLDIEKYVRMVYDHGAKAKDAAPLFRVTVLFSETAGKTKMEMTMACVNAEAAANIKQHIKKAGGEATWDRLAEYLSPTDKFVINRSFDAPQDLVFEMWTNPKHFSQWLAPTGFTMDMHQSEIKVGSTLSYSMTGPNGIKMYGEISYKEITRPTRLVYTQIFCDEQGNVSRHPMAPTWPETMLTTITLAKEDAQKTRLTITWEVYGDANAAERETFNKAKGGMTQGWTGSFEKLEQYLSEYRSM